jgi:26S proteasome regulatory subunit N8
MIGWYHTGPKLRASDQEINDLFKRFIAKPVMVIVDVRPNTVGIPTDAYFAIEEIKDVSTHPCIFLATNPKGQSEKKMLIIP